MPIIKPLTAAQAARFHTASRCLQQGQHAEALRLARKRAQEAMDKKHEKEDLVDASAELQKHLARLRAAELVKHRRTPDRSRQP